LDLRNFVFRVTTPSPPRQELTTRHRLPTVEIALRICGKQVVEPGDIDVSYAQVRPFRHAPAYQRQLGH